MAHGHQLSAVQARHWRGAGEAAETLGGRSSPRARYGPLLHRAPRWPLPGWSGGTAHPPAPSHYWKSMCHDTAAVDANAFACGFSVFGADHVVFATDYPYGRNKGEYFLESR